MNVVHKMGLLKPKKAKRVKILFVKIKKFPSIMLDETPIQRKIHDVPNRRAP